MTDALKQIEEKHGVGGGPVSLLSNYCTICDTKTPCDALKLARALDDLADTIAGEHPCPSCHDRAPNADCDCAEQAINRTESLKRARRTLEEVAGE